MSLSDNVSSLAGRVAAEIKALRTLVNDNQADLSALTTVDKTNLVAALNELKAAVDASAGSASIEVSDTAPADPTPNMLWWDSSSGVLYIYYDNFWVEAVANVLSGEAININAESPLSYDPETATLSIDLSAYDTIENVDSKLLALENNINLSILIADSNTLSNANAYTDTKLTDANSYTDTKFTAANSYTDTKVASLVDAAPSTLNTLNELAAALGDDPNFATTVTNSIASKLPLTGGTLTGPLTVDTAGQALTISGDSTVDAADASIYMGNAAYGWNLWYRGTGLANENTFEIESTNNGTPVTALSIKQDGTTELNGATTLAETVTASKGMKLGNVASADVNTLDYYEEAAWTPVITFGGDETTGITWTNRFGNYTRIGNMVHFQASMVFTKDAAATGFFRINLPLAAKSFGSYAYEGVANIAFVAGLVDSAQIWSGYINDSDSTVTIAKWNSNSTMSNTHFVDGLVSIRVSGTYIAA